MRQQAKIAAVFYFTFQFKVFVFFLIYKARIPLTQFGNSFYLYCCKIYQILENFRINVKDWLQKKKVFDKYHKTVLITSRL